jgi:hypothetical protein
VAIPAAYQGNATPRTQVAGTAPRVGRAPEVKVFLLLFLQKKKILLFLKKKKQKNF